MALEDNIIYEFAAARMDSSVPSVRVQPASLSYLAGADGRMVGCIRKFYGMKEILRLSEIIGLETIGDYSGVSFLQHVIFTQYGTASTYRGFVVRWDSQNSTSNQQIDLVYSLDNGSTWAVFAIWAAGNSITNVLKIECESHKDYLFVCVEGKTPKTIYYSGANLVSIDMGPGAFDVALGAMTLASDSVDTDYQLTGNGIFQIAWRFYSSVRGVYSALSNPVTVHLNHYKLSAASATFTANNVGGDGGLMVDGDVFTINGRTYEADNNSAITSDVAVDITGFTTMAECCQSFADAINGDTSPLATVTARAGAAYVYVEAKVRGSGGNSYGISVTEIAPNQDDWYVSTTTLMGGGVQTTEPETQCKIVLDLPNDDAVVAGQVYANFAALFDTIDIYRTIDMGSSLAASSGGIFWLESSIVKAGNWALEGTWDSLQVTVGGTIDMALIGAGNMFDPEKDLVLAPPNSSAIVRYQNITFMDDGRDTVHSSLRHASAEYFTTYNRHTGMTKDGYPLRYIPVADSMFILATSSITHVYKSAQTQPLQFVGIQSKRGLVGKWAAHAVGNSVLMMIPSGLVLLDGTNGNIGQISAADGFVEERWRSYLSGVQSGFDAGLNASFFLCPNLSEVLVVWHAMQVVNMLEGANFACMTEGPDIATDTTVRAYFTTANGIIVTPDINYESSGTMHGLSSDYTLNGTTTASGTTLVDSNATFHADMVGCMVYMTSGDNAGVWREISSVDVGNHTLTLSSNFSYQITKGDRYAVSAIALKARLWPIQDPEDLNTALRRKNVTGIILDVKNTEGFANNVNNEWRVGGYKNGSSVLHGSTDMITVSENPSDSAGSINIDGICVEMYIEQISSGVNFDLIRALIHGSITDSMKVGA